MSCQVDLRVANTKSKEPEDGEWKPKRSLKPFFADDVKEQW